MIPTLLVTALASLNAHGFITPPPTPTTWVFQQRVCEPVTDAYACVFTSPGVPITMQVPNGATIDVYSHESAHVMDFTTNVTITRRYALRPLLFRKQHAHVSFRHPAASLAAMRERLADMVSSCSGFKPVYLYVKQWALPKPTAKLCRRLVRLTSTESPATVATPPTN